MKELIERLRGIANADPDYADDIEEAIQALSQSDGPRLPPDLIEVLRYLNGEGTLDGFSYGDGAPPKKGRYWWRSRLRPYLLPSPDHPQEQMVEKESGGHKIIQGLQEAVEYSRGDKSKGREFTLGNAGQVDKETLEQAMRDELGCNELEQWAAIENFSTRMVMIALIRKLDERLPKR